LNLKKIKIIYGNKYVKKINNLQKTKLMEKVLQDHTFKKEKVYEFMHYIHTFEDSLEYFNESLTLLEESFNSVIIS